MSTSPEPLQLPANARALSTSQAKQAQQAFNLLQSGRAGEALEQARALAAMAPQAPDAQQLLGLCLVRCRMHVEAEAAFRRALKLAPGQRGLVANLSTLLRDLGRPGEAMQLWQQQARLDPARYENWIELAWVAFEAGASDQAELAVRRALALDTKPPTGWHVLGQVLSVRDDLAGAEQAFRKAAERAPSDPAHIARLGATLRLLGRSEEAVLCLRAALDSGIESPPLRDVLTGALLDSGNVEAALANASELITTAPDFASGHRTLAHVLWEHGTADAEGNPCNPLRSYEQRLAAEPSDASLRLEYAALLLEMKRAEDCIEQVRQLRSKADHPYLMTLEANALEVAGRSAAAGALYVSAHEILGDRDPSFLNAYVRHLLKAGQIDSAAERAQAALRREPNNQEAWAYLATAWRLLGDDREEWLCGYDELVSLVEIDGVDGVDPAVLRAELGLALQPLHESRREPIHQSLRGGSQTPGRLFGRPQAAIEATRRALLRAIEKHLAKLQRHPEHPFLKRLDRSVRISGSWSVKLWSSGKHANHIHPEGWMSSAYYIELPPSVSSGSADSNAGHIQFGQPPEELGLDLGPRRVIRPREGWLALFPSYLWHGTVPFEDSRPRVTLAFDMLPSPKALP